MTRLIAINRLPPGSMTLDKTISFDGTSTVITIPDNAAYSYATASALSISLWVNPANLSMLSQEGTGYCVFLSKVGLNTNEWEFRMYQTGNSEGRANRISFYTFAAAGGLGDGVAVTETVVPGEWIHLVATIDSAKLMKLYKNGVKKDQQTSTMTMTDTNSIVRIGAGASNSSGITSYWQGAIDDVRIFNRVLNQTEIDNLFKTNRRINQGEVGYWALNENTGITATDSSITANNGTITGGTWISSLSRNRLVLKADKKWQSTTLTAVNVPNIRKMVRDMGTKSLKLNGTNTAATNATYVLSPTAFSIAYWVKVNKFTANDRIFDQQDAGPANGATFIESVAAGSNQISFTIRNAGTNVASLSTVELLEPNIWYHIVGTYTVDKVDLYLNGIQQATDTSATMTAATAVFSVGSRAGGGNWFNGILHDFIVFPRKLTEQEVQDLYFNAILPKGADMNISFNNSVTDSSGNGRDLTSSNTSFISDVPLKLRNTA